MRPGPGTLPLGRRRRTGTGDEGFSLVIVSLTLVVLMTFVGFSIDTLYWRHIANRAQRAADAAALAGVIHLPGDLAPAEQQARLVAAANGFTDGSNDTVVTAGYGAKPSQLTVTVRTRAGSFFAKLVGLNSIGLQRSATAEYQGPVPMGSPVSWLGTDPDLNRRADFWLNVAGPSATKISGDRFTANVCNPSTTFGCRTDGSNTNAEYRGSIGYVFAIEVPTVAAGRDLRVDVFDPALIFTGDTCTSAMPSASLVANWQATHGTNTAMQVPGNPLYTGQPMYADATQRYAQGGQSAFCTGDQNIGGANADTTYTFRWPSTNAFDVMAGPVITTASCSPTTFRAIAGGPGGPGGSGGLLDPANSSTDAQYVKRTFHRWVTTCRIPNPPAGTYILQVTAPNGGGHNRFSLRAGTVPSGGNGTLDGTGVRLYATERLPMYVNAITPSGAAGTPTFYLARIPEGSGGRELALDFFDIGDVTGGTTTFQVLPPTAGATCRINGVDSPTCTLANIDSGSSYNGRLQRASLRLPTGYACNPDPAIECWVRIRMTYSAGAQPVDTTTWTASMVGDPIRLVR